MAFVVAEPCINCKYTDCVAVCPVECFREGNNFLVIDPDVCIDCGACVPECPTEAIFDQDELPEKWSHFLELNAELSADFRYYNPSALLWLIGGPVAGVIILAAAPDHVPRPLVDQLAPGGRLVLPVGPDGAQTLTVLEKGADGKVTRTEGIPVRFVPMTGEAREKATAQ